MKGEKEDGREFVFTHINTIASGRSYTMRSLQGKRFGLIWNGWSNGETVFKNESMSGLTWKAMVAAAKTNPQIAARVKHFSHRTPLEFYDYEQDPDALSNRIDDAEIQETVAAYRARLAQWMKSTGDFALRDYKMLAK